MCSWSPVELPHVAASSSSDRPNKWWYRKQFEWIITDQDLTESVHLMFKSLHNNTKERIDMNTISDKVTIWLDGVKLSSSLVAVPNIVIDLRPDLLVFSQAKNYKNRHTLLVCCRHVSLALHSYLTVSCEALSSVSEAEFNAAIGNVALTNSRSNRISDYVSLFDDVEKRATLVTNDARKSLQRHSKTSISLDSMNDSQPSVSLLSIVMLIVGTRGDVQPFIAYVTRVQRREHLLICFSYGKVLRAAGHRVRLATHEKFRQFVRENDLEFYPLARDPAEIMCFMVEDSGIFPSFSSIVTGSVFKRLRLFSDILESTWLACINHDDETGAPFRAEAIIANPICYGHIHCAQKLGIPLHMVFTQPSMATAAFPHPLANVDYSKATRERLNHFSYTMVEVVVRRTIRCQVNVTLI
jgi:hypothetical protein